MATLTDLRNELENDELLQSRTIEMTLDGRTLRVVERGNPALEVDDENHTVAETGEDDVPGRIEEYAFELFGHSGYSCSVNADTDMTETKIVV